MRYTKPQILKIGDASQSIMNTMAKNPSPVIDGDNGLGTLDPGYDGDE